MRKRSAFLDLKEPERRALFDKHIASLSKKMGVGSSKKAELDNGTEPPVLELGVGRSTPAAEEASSGKPKEEGEEEDGEEKDEGGPQSESPAGSKVKKRELLDLPEEGCSSTKKPKR